MKCCYIELNGIRGVEIDGPKLERGQVLDVDVTYRLRKKLVQDMKPRRERVRVVWCGGGPPTYDYFRSWCERVR